MSLSSEQALFPAPSATDESIYAYSTSNSSPDDTNSLFYDDEDVDYRVGGDLNSSLSITLNDTLLDVFSKTIGHRSPGDENITQIAIGVTLSVLANTIVGVSIVLKKQALKQIKADGGTPASQGGLGYLKSKRWWFGLTVLALGDLFGFMSLIFAPTILVTSMSVLSIVVACIMSHFFLKEKLTRLAIIGCGLVMVGCFIVTLCGPKVQEIASMDELEFYLQSPGFISYTAIVVVISVVLMSLSTKYGSRYIFLNTFIVGMYSSLSIILSKGVGIGVKLTFEGENAFIRWGMWACVVAMSFTLTMELIYTQRSLDVFNIYLLIPVWYVLVSALVILLSMVLFSKSRTMGWKDTTLTISGFVINTVALLILTIDKTQNKEAETEQESAENERPPIPHLGGVTDLYEIQQNPDKGNPSSVASKVSSMMMKPSGPPHALANMNGVISSEQGKTNSCFSLISEEPSTSNTSVSNADSNSQGGSSNGSDLKSSDGNSSGGVSDSPHSSCSSHRRGAAVAGKNGDERQQSLANA